MRSHYTPILGSYIRFQGEALAMTSSSFALSFSLLLRYGGLRAVLSIIIHRQGNRPKVSSLAQDHAYP